ncbi:MAG: UbiA family prenyltransferase [Halobacteriales archaeon]
MHVTAYTYPLRPLAGISRVPFLLLSAVVVANGAAAAAWAGAFDATHTLLALVGLLSLHASVNALNEASDFVSGIDLHTDPTPFSGGSKTIPEGELAARTAYRYGFAAAAVGALVGAYFLVEFGAIMLPFIVVGAISVLFYTDYLTKLGVGEAAAGLGLGALPVAGTAVVQDGTIAPPVVAVSIPAFFLTFNLLLLNEFPDVEADRVGGRKNLVHRLGRQRAAWVYVIAAVAVPTSIIAAVVLETLPPIALLGVLPSAVLARPASWALEHAHEEPTVDDLRDNVLWVLGTNALLALGLYLAMPTGATPPTTDVSVFDSAFLAGRVIFAGSIAVMAINNFVDLDTVTEKIADKGVAHARPATLVASSLLLASAGSILLGVRPDLGAAYVILFMVGSTFVVHNFWSIDDPDEQDNEAFHFFKNVAILGGALLVLASAGSAWPYAVG